MLTFSAGTVLVLFGAGAAYFLTVATADALATTATVLMAGGIVGLLIMACVVAARLAGLGRDGGGGPNGGAPQPLPTPDDAGAELVRILDDPRLGDLRLTRDAPLHRRRRAA
jgi:hypothetical protein